MTFVNKGKAAARTGAAAVAVTVAVLAAVTLPAGAAQPDLTTRCVGVAGPVTVPGNLVVPAGRSCELQGTIVEGDVRVAAGANLIAEAARLNGALVAQADAYVELTNSTVAGRITLRDAYGLYSEASELGGVAVHTVDADAVPAVVFSVDSAIDGGLNARVGDILISGTTVAGSVRGEGVGYLDVINSVVGDTLGVVASAEGSVVCDSEVYGDTVFTGNGGVVQLGGGPLAVPCAGANYWDGHVAIDDTTGGVWVTDNIIRGGLAGGGNEPAPVGDNNRVRGATGGQFADLQPGAEPSAQPSVTVDRHRELHARVGQRQTAAMADAQNAGPANL